MRHPLCDLTETASNRSQGCGVYTGALFLADFPQFTGTDGQCLAPALILEGFLARASAVLAPEKWGQAWRYACGLYTAHQLTLYLRTYAPHSVGPAQAAAGGATLGIVKSAALGDASVTYDTGALTAATQTWGGLNATQYGQLLATEARLAGMGGSLVL